MSRISSLVRLSPFFFMSCTSDLTRLVLGLSPNTYFVVNHYFKRLFRRDAYQKMRG